MKRATREFAAASVKLDYSLIGVNSTASVEQGLVEADWYQTRVPSEVMRSLLTRRDGPAIRDTILWFSLILGSGCATYFLWGSRWGIVTYLIYSVLYASTSDSRWHESGHGTAFKTDWMNNVLYEIASFMVMRESTVWRWSHNRHHSDTIIIGRDPEIAVPRPPDICAIVLSFFNLGVYPTYFKRVFLHAIGQMDEVEKTFIPEMEYSAVYLRARVYVAVYTMVIGLAIFSHSVLPLLFVGLANLFGSWLLVLYGLTQHAGLAENVLDHRLNCRTVYMNPIHRYLYWNMNYHIEHHMFPLVPYHALEKLHAVVKEDCPAPYPSLLAAWREIMPTIFKQVKDPAYHVKRQLPVPKTERCETSHFTNFESDPAGWIAVCNTDDLNLADIRRFDHRRKAYILCRGETGKLYATDGVCTHGNAHLSQGLILEDTIECPKHNGRFNLVDGSPARAPICRGLATYPVAERGGKICVNVNRAQGIGARVPKTFQFRVISNRCVSTFIKELVLEPLQVRERIAFTPGDYIQLNIPQYDAIRFCDFEIPEPFATVWRNQHIFDLVSTNPEDDRRNNYSIASNQQTETTLRFNVRIATPPVGQNCVPGIGSSYIFNLRPGDIISGLGPYGDFHIKPTKREMVYIGGGAGMAPLRAHLSHLLENERTDRRVSYWYGARSKQELFYENYFQILAKAHHNFTFHPALSAPLAGDRWTGQIGFIHDIVFDQYLRRHPRPQSAEYYLCGPPLMIKASVNMLARLGVPQSQIAYDEF